MKVNVKLQRMYVGTNKGLGHINGSSGSAAPSITVSTKFRRPKRMESELYPR